MVATTRTDMGVAAAHTVIMEALAREPAADGAATLGRLAKSREGALAAMRAIPQRVARELLDRGGPLGEGGMGIVRVARQRSVGRDVAVKSLRDENRFEAAEVALLQEAWLTASLEHPNVVPVHDVLVDPVDGPLIVLKQVKGTAWDDVIGDAALVRERFSADDLLEFNLDVLMQLCRAVHFAHANGVVHRDIKPSNVMVGAFGEVYLVDWGIAVSLAPDPTGRLPLAPERPPLAGTLSYMAPEMLDPDVGRIGPRTDVYLLGAVLYEVVVGYPPHRHDDNHATAMSILESRPTFPEAVPEELARIVARAMSPEPLDRHDSAEALRLDVSHFLRNRDSMRLVDEALARYGDLTWLLDMQDPDQVSKARLFELFGQCRFGLQQALVGWAGNQRARAALVKLLDRMIAYLLRTGDPGAAGALFGEHPDPDAALRAQVDAALSAQKRERGELERLQRDLDPTVGIGARRFALVAMGVLWTFAPLLANVVDPATTPAIVNHVSPIVLFTLAVGVWYAARDKLAKTAINRRFLVAMLVGFCAHMVHLLVVALAGLAPKTELAMGMVSFGAIAAVLAYTADKRLWPLVPVYWLGALGAAASVDHAAYVLSGCNLVLTLYMLAIWSPRAGDPQALRARRS